MSTRTITLSAEHWQRISEALDTCYDEGPPGEGWKSAELSSAVAALDAALAQPEAVGPTAKQLADTYWDAVNAHKDRKNVILHDVGLRAVLARWGHPTPQPIPVSERLPEPADCAPWPDGPTANHWCWLGKEVCGGWEWAQASAMGIAAKRLEWSLAGGGWTHWFPHWALPLPGAPGG